MDSSGGQWIGLTSILLQAAMVFAPFMFTWRYCDRPETFTRRCLRAMIASAIFIAVSALVLLVFYSPHFPEGEIFGKVRETLPNALIASVLGPLMATDFLMRIKVGYRARKARGHHEL